MSASNTGTELFTCTVNRRLTGLEFRLKSSQIEEAMRLISSERIRRDNNGNVWDGNTFYQVDMGSNGIPVSLPGYTSGRFDMWGSRELLLSPRTPNLNLSMLLAVGLKDGVNIRIPTVISETQLKLYLDGLKGAVRQFYIDFLKESTKNIRIITEEFCT